MKYEKDLMASWDEYAIKKTLREEGREEGAEQKSYEVVKNLLSAGEFTVAKIANFANVSESFVRKVKKGLK